MKRARAIYHYVRIKNFKAQVQDCAYKWVEAGDPETLFIIYKPGSPRPLTLRSKQIRKMPRLALPQTTRRMSLFHYGSNWRGACSVKRGKGSSPIAPQAQRARGEWSFGGEITCKLYVVTSGTHAFCLFKSSCSEPSETQKRGTQKLWSILPFGEKGRNFHATVFSHQFWQWTTP